MSFVFVTRIEEVKGLSDAEKQALKEVTKRFVFRTNEYYLSLINWDDPNDPLRRVVIPHPDELEEWGDLDPSHESHYTVLPGVQHKYSSTVLFLVSNVCGSICRYCFRKRIFLREKMEVLRDLEAALEYVREHKEITNVLLTGGDALMLSTPKLEEIIKRLREIEHVQIIRIGTRLLAYNPFRILNDPSLLELVEKYSDAEKRIYFMAHFIHSNELTTPALKAIDLLLQKGAILANQTPLIRGVNDNPHTLAELFKKLSFAGVPPYYVFQCRPSSGNKIYAVPIEEGYQIFEQAKSMVSGLAKRARFVMSHSTGKIEVVGLDAEHIYFKYHRAANNEDSGKFMVFKRNPEAYWFDDYDEMIKDYPITAAYKTYGPE